MSQFEQRENVKFYQNLGKSASETFQMIKQAYGKEALGCSAVLKWHKRFAQGRDSLEDDAHIGRPRTVRTELKIQEAATLVCANRFQTLDEIAAAGISHGTFHKILSGDLNMSHVTQHSVPRGLRQDQCDDRMSICGDLIDSSQWRLF
jgi:transposase